MFSKASKATTTKATTTKAAAPAKATKAATKAAPKAKATPAKAATPTLTPNQRKLLAVIVKGGKTPTSYKAMRAATGMRKGLSKAVGTPSKAASGANTLLGLGYVEVVNKSIPFTFIATTKGKDALK